MVSQGKWGAAVVHHRRHAAPHQNKVGSERGEAQYARCGSQTLTPDYIRFIYVILNGYE